MAKTRIAGAVGALAATAVLLTACGSSPEPTVTPAATPSSPVTQAATASPTASTSKGVNVETVEGAVTVPKNGYFLFPIPPSLVTGGDAASWKWTLSYDKDTLIAAADVTSSPKDSSKIVMGDAQGGQVWQAKGRAGTTTITYSYVDPSTPTALVKGTYAVTVE